MTSRSERQGNGQGINQEEEHNQQHDLHKILRGIRYDLTALQAKVSDAFALLNEMHLPDPSRATCPTCQLTFKGELPLAEHRYQQHNGPVPAHWLEAEARAAPDPAPSAAPQPAKEPA